MRICASSLLLCLATVPVAFAFNIPGPQQSKSNVLVEDKNVVSSRRGFGQRLAGIVTGSVLVGTTGLPASSLAKQNPQELEDKEKLKKGYDRLNYLLENWEKLTTVCGKSDNPYLTKNGCERSPLLVMDYMGYRSMNDPLFKADKTLKRLSGLVPSDDSVDYLDAMEKWGEAAEEASGMAYISSWGEANPGGGKDRVEYWIERSRKNVTDARDSLETALRILGQI